MGVPQATSCPGHDVNFFVQVGRAAQARANAESTPGGELEQPRQQAHVSQCCRRADRVVALCCAELALQLCVLLLCTSRRTEPFGSELCCGHMAAAFQKCKGT